MDRYVAIDNVCAWPNLTLLPDGTPIATIFNQPTHGGWEGDVECWAGAEGGRFWSRRGTPAPHEPATNRMNVAAGLAADGAMIVLASGWSRRNRVGDYSSPHQGEILPLWSCRSTDGARTWTHTPALIQPADIAAKLIPFGDILVLPDRSAGVCIYSWAPQTQEHACHFFVSADGGRSWSRRGTIRDHNINETTPLLLPDGRLLVAARTLGDQHLELFESTDLGATWRNLGPVSLGGQHPAHLLLLKNGHLLLSYGLRNKGCMGVGIRLSTDGGTSWSPPRVLVNLSGAGDVGYPSTIELADGTLVTAYYCNGIPEHQRYHMGVVRWKIDE